MKNKIRILCIGGYFPTPDVFSERERDPRSYFFIDYLTEWTSLGYEVHVLQTPPKYSFLFEFILKLLIKLGFKRFERYLRDPRTISSNSYDKWGIKFLRVPIKKVFPKSGYSLNSLKKASEYFNKGISGENYDLVLCDYIEPSVKILDFLDDVDYKNTYLVFHKTDLDYIRRNTSHYIELLKRFDGIVYRSLGLKRQCEGMLGDNLKGINSYFMPSGISKNVSLGPLRTTAVKNFLYVGRLVPEKGVKDLLVCFAQLRKSNYDINLTIVGDGPLKEFVHTYIKENNLTNHVKLYNRLTHNEVFEVMSRADCFVMVSNETFGMVYIEAMSKGCLVVAARGQGMSGIIEDGVNGYFAELGDKNSLESVVTKILSLKTTEVETISRAAILTAKQMRTEFLSEKLIQELVNP